MWRYFKKRGVTDCFGAILESFSIVNYLFCAGFVTVGAGCTGQGKPKEVSIGCVRLADYPVKTGVSAPFIGIHGQKLMVAGGCNFPDIPVAEGGKKKYYSQVFVMDTVHPEKSEWVDAGFLPYTVAYGATVSLEQQGVLCIGGCNADSLLTTVTLISWDDSSGKALFTSWPDLPEPLDNSAGVRVGNCVYVLGGNASGEPSGKVYCLDMYRLEAGWKQLNSIPGSARVQPCVAASGNKIYLAGGFQPAGEGHSFVIPADCWVLDTGTGQWQLSGPGIPVKENHPFSLIGAGAVTRNDGSLLFAGGVDYERFQTALQREKQMQEAIRTGDETRIKGLKAEAREYLLHPEEWYRFNADLLMFDPEVSQWGILGTNASLARAGAGVVSDGNRLFIVCGEIKPGIRTSQVSMLNLNLK